jgi:rhomboid protease GluP
MLYSEIMGSIPPQLPPDRWEPGAGSWTPQPHQQNPGYQPEVLPPEGSYAPPRPVRRRRTGWAAAPATHLLLAINCAVFLWMLAHGVSPTGPSVEQLMRFGADNAGNVLVYGEWWRIVSAMFVHVGIIHLATNMWCLWNLGMLAEPLMGSLGVAAVYILTGAAGNLLSTLVNWVWPIREAGSVVFPAGAGASGAVFGIAGALIILLKSKRLPVPQHELKRLRRSVIYFAAINLAIGFSISGCNFVFRSSGLNIDNMAHLGGFTSGLLFAAPMVPRLGSSNGEFQTRLRLSTIGMVILLVLFGFYIAHISPPQGF